MFFILLIMRDLKMIFKGLVYHYTHHLKVESPISGKNHLTYTTFICLFPPWFLFKELQIILKGH